MTVLYIDGFDAQDWAMRWSIAGTGAISASATTPYGVGSSLQRATSNFSTGGTVSSVKHLFGSAVAQAFCGFQFHHNGGHNTTINVCSFQGDNGATTHGIVKINTSGQLLVTNGAGTVLFTSTAVLADNDWNFIEFTQTVSDTVGIYELKLNGVSLFTFSGDTKNAGTNTTIDAITLGGGVVGNGAVSGTILFDDLYVLSSAGSRNNAFLGARRVQTITPSGAGSSTQFTPASGTNFSNVNDIPDVTTTYVQDTVSGHRDTYAMSDLVAGTDSIDAVQQCMHATNPDGGTATIKQAQKSGATVSYGATKTLSASVAWYNDLSETNPATSSPYTQTEINALEAGFEVV